MQIAVFDGDLVRLPAPGDTELVEVPPALDGWPLEYLRWDGAELAALQQLGEREFHVGADGVLRLVAGDGRQALVCAYDDVLLRDGDTWRVETAEVMASARRLAAVKAECRRRIYAVAAPEAQMNVATAASVASAKAASNRSTVEAAIIAGAAAGIEWVAAMRATVLALVSDDAADFMADAAWPVCPPEVAAVYGEF